MSEVLATPNYLSIGSPNSARAILLGMATTVLGRRLHAIRKAAGYGDNAAKFARLIGIRPASLHDLESGESKSLGGKSLVGYLKIGANRRYIFEGKGPPMLKDPDKNARAQSIISMLFELDDKEIDTVETMVQAFYRARRIVVMDSDRNEAHPSGERQ